MKDCFIDVRKENFSIFDTHGKTTFNKKNFQIKQKIAETDGIVIGWKLKDLFSVEDDLNFQKIVFDLQILESFIGVRRSAPNSFKESKDRLKIVFNDINWKRFFEIYKQVYFPLLSIIKNIEDVKIKKNGKNLKTYYDLSTHINFRLICRKQFDNYFNPHSLSWVKSDNLLPIYNYQRFLYFDYKNMEVSVLQWLSGDLKLKELLNTNDFYSSLWEFITNKTPTELDRKKCKNVFLGIIYGMGVNEVAKRLEVNFDFAKEFINKIYKEFSVAMNWLIVQQENHKNGVVYDYFGRKRIFKDNFHRIRNFYISSTSSLICLDHLVKLFLKLKKHPASIAYHVHDGYMLFSRRRHWNELIPIVKSSLQEESLLYKKLKLNVSCFGGNTLNSMSEIKWN